MTGGKEKDPLGLFKDEPQTPVQQTGGGAPADPLGLFSQQEAPVAPQEPETQFPLTEGLRKHLLSTITDQTPMALAQAAAGSVRGSYSDLANSGQGLFPKKAQLEGLTKEEIYDKFGDTGSNWVKHHIRSLLGFPSEQITFRKILDNAYAKLGPNPTHEEL